MNDASITRRLSAVLMIAMGAAVTLLVCLAIVFATMSESAKYRFLGDESRLVFALAWEIDNGDTITEVKERLGPWEHEKSKKWINIQTLTSGTDRFIRMFPEGIKETDRFFAYQGEFQIVLQFRDERLINLNKSWLYKATKR